MDIRVNRNVKDTVFRDIFGAPERKQNALDLYNALAGTDYDDLDDLELTTLDDIIYLNVKNDISFLIGDEMVLFEHQSTHNPNMPVRGLLYFARLYSRFIKSRDYNIYGSRLIELPPARYVVFYSGRAPRPEQETLRLTDAFGGKPSSVEVSCEVVNVNADKIADLAAKCPALAAYAFFVARVRKYNGSDGIDLAAAVDCAIDDCVAAGHLPRYFDDKRAEVRDMFMTEYDAERQRELDRRDAREEGREEGRQEGRIEALSALVRKGLITPSEAADFAGMTPDQFAERQEALQ